MSAYSHMEEARYIGNKKRMLVSYNLFLRQIDKKLNNTVLLSRPTTIQFEPTTKCNLKCPNCESLLWGRRGMDMNFSDFKKIIDQFPYLVTLLLQGIGEPLICKDFFKMIEYCKYKKILVGITTNGTLIDEQMAKKLVDNEIDYMIISIDGATAETFEKTKDAKFEEVLGNARNLIKARGNLEKPRISFIFTGTKDNIHELPQIVKLAKDIGADMVEAQDTHCWGDERLKETLNNNTLRQDIERAKKFANEAIIKAKELNIPFEWNGGGNRKPFLFLDTDLQMHADQKLCMKVFKSCFITVDGYVTTCACAPDPRRQNFGNVLEQNFDEIWNSQKYVEFRKARLQGKIPDFCRMCTVPHTTW